MTPWSRRGTLRDITGHLRTGAASVDLTPYTEDLDLATVTAREELTALLTTVHLRADRPSLRTLEARSRHGPTPLSKTVVSEMLKGTRFPRKAVMLAFLEACGVHGGDLESWKRAWERIAVSEQGPAWPGSPAAPEGREWLIGSARRPEGRETAGSADPQDHGRTVGTGLSHGASSEIPEPSGKEQARDQINQRRSTSEQQLPPAAAGERSIRRDHLAGDATSPGPTVRRRELGILLRALREEKGITVEQAAEHLLCSPGKVSRMEADFRAGTLRDVRDLCGLYGVLEGPQRDHLMNLARESRQQGWWQSYELMGFSTYIGLENGAASLKEYEGAMVPGLLQTADYARAMHRNNQPEIVPERIEELIQVRLTRQLILTRADPPRLWAILGEAALRQSVGGPEIMRAQLDHLIRISMLPNVTLQVLPFSKGANPALSGSSFSIMEFAAPAPDLVYTEGLFGWIYLERLSDVERYQKAFEVLRDAALKEEGSKKFIAEVIGEMRRIG
jgi:transcriptional regulator with XRE-family HTH domain